MKENSTSSSEDFPARFEELARQLENDPDSYDEVTKKAAKLYQEAVQAGRLEYKNPLTSLNIVGNMIGTGNLPTPKFCPDDFSVHTNPFSEEGSSRFFLKLLLRDLSTMAEPPVDWDGWARIIENCIQDPDSVLNDILERMVEDMQLGRLSEKPDYDTFIKWFFENFRMKEAPKVITPEPHYDFLVKNGLLFWADQRPFGYCRPEKPGQPMSWRDFTEPAKQRAVDLGLLLPLLDNDKAPETRASEPDSPRAKAKTGQKKRNNSKDKTEFPGELHIKVDPVNWILYYSKDIDTRGQKARLNLTKLENRFLSELAVCGAEGVDKTSYRNPSAADKMISTVNRKLVEALSLTSNPITSSGDKRALSHFASITLDDGELQDLGIHAQLDENRDGDDDSRKEEIADMFAGHQTK